MEEKIGKLAELCRRMLGSWRGCGGEFLGADGAVEESCGNLAELCKRNVGAGGAVEENCEERVERRMSKLSEELAEL